MSTNNRVTLVGYVGKDIKFGENEQFISFSVGTNESWIDKTTKERKESTDWHRVVVYNNYLIKCIRDVIKVGSKIVVIGSLKTRKWTDDKNQNHYITEVVVNFGDEIIIEVVEKTE
ncbi:MAG: single-stranded DNA-binding protein [Gilliamella sp.]|nr:single-stranded DNA-binding protein [Gilliamella sp.]